MFLGLNVQINFQISSKGDVTFDLMTRTTGDEAANSINEHVHFPQVFLSFLRSLGTFNKEEGYAKNQKSVQTLMGISFKVFFFFLNQLQNSCYSICWTLIAWTTLKRKFSSSNNIIFWILINNTSPPPKSINLVTWNQPSHLVTMSTSNIMN